MTRTQYKGLVWIASGIIAAGGGALFFESTNRLPMVHAVDVAELAAKVIEISGEYAGGTNIPKIWTMTEWSIYTNAVTNGWGGYDSFTRSIAGYAPLNGTYIFVKRALPSAIAFPCPGQTNLITMSDGLQTAYYDVYTNSTTQFSGYIAAIYDGGPGVGWFSQYQAPIGWVTPISGPYSNITETLALTGITYPGAGTNRQRYFYPATNIVYTNTIGLMPQRATIFAITNALKIVANHGGPTCFVGPTNADATYDGVTNFPPVWGSAWYTNYVAQVYRVCASNLPFITTNELAWHYSALYRMRDQQVTVNLTNAAFFVTSGFSTDSYENAYAALVTAWNGGSPSAPNEASPGDFHYAPGVYLYKYSSYGSYRVTLCVCTGQMYVEGLWTGTPKSVEWYINPKYGEDDSDYAYISTFNGYETASYSNAWTFIGKSGINNDASVVSPYFGGWTLPPFSDIDASEYSVGWTCGVQAYLYWPTMRAVIRWQQTTCTNAIFDGRYP